MLADSFALILWFGGFVALGLRYVVLQQRFFRALAQRDGSAENPPESGTLGWMFSFRWAALSSARSGEFLHRQEDPATESVRVASLRYFVAAVLVGFLGLGVFRGLLLMVPFMSTPADLNMAYEIVTVCFFVLWFAVVGRTLWFAVVGLGRPDRRRTDWAGIQIVWSRSTLFFFAGTSLLMIAFTIAALTLIFHM